jgi:hypothetical protein
MDMIKRGDKKGAEGISTLGMIGGLVLIIALVAIILVYLMKGTSVADDVLNVVPSDLALLTSYCEGISKTTENALFLSCGDFKNLGKVEGHERYGSCAYILKQYKDESKTTKEIDCSGYDVEKLAEEFCSEKGLKITDFVNDEACSYWKKE